MNDEDYLGSLLTINLCRMFLGSAAEWERYNSAFDVMSNDGSIDARLYRQRVLGPSVPAELAERLFDVFDVQRRGTLNRDVDLPFQLLFVFQFLNSAK